MKSRRILTILFVSVVTLLTTRCNDDEGVTYSMKDVSSRITGFNNPKTGPGAELTLNGSNLGKVQRIFIGNNVVLARNFINHTESAITFVVPTTVGVYTDGTLTDVIVVFNGSERAFTQIEVVPFQAISSFAPRVAAAGELVTLQGVNLNLVTAVKVNDVTATISSKTPNSLKFTMPAGAATGRIILLSEAGESKSANDLISCESQPGNVGCNTNVINTNGSFEDTDVGVVGAISGWNLGGARITSEITDETSYRGNKCVKITVNSIGSNPWDIQPTANVPVNPAKTYILSVWVKGSGLANVKFAIDEGGSPGYAEFAAPQTAINADQWTEITYEFSPASETNPPGDGVARFAISMSYAGNVGGVMYMDDLRVVEKP